MNHIADCDDYAFSGAGFHPNCERICICRQVRRVEQRVLNAAREAVAKAWHCPDPMNCTVDEPVCGNRREILAAIDALKEKS